MHQLFKKSEMFDKFQKSLDQLQRKQIKVEFMRQEAEGGLVVCFRKEQKALKIRVEYAQEPNLFNLEVGMPSLNRFSSLTKLPQEQHLEEIMIYLASMFWDTDE